MMRILLPILLLLLCVSCGDNIPFDKNGNTPKEVFNMFLKAVKKGDVAEARSYWSGTPNRTNGGGKGDFKKDVFGWWQSFDRVEVTRTYRGKVEYFHVVTECYKNGKKEAWPEPAMYLENGTWKIHRNIWW